MTVPIPTTTGTRLLGEVLAWACPGLSVAHSALVTALKDPDAEVRVQAAHALGELRSAAAVPALIAALADDNHGCGPGRIVSWTSRQIRPRCTGSSRSRDLM